MSRLIWSVPARNDLRSIDAWLEREASPAVALHTLSSIRLRAEHLRSFPHGARPLRDGTRVLRVFHTPYLIRYRIVTGRVEVLRIHHEREDWLVPE